jgi:hypothetical protein
MWLMRWLARWSRLCRAASRSRSARHFVVVEDPFWRQYTAGVLSQWVCTVSPTISLLAPITDWWTSVPASSKSELVIWPVGFLKEHKRDCVVSEKGALQSKGCESPWSVSNQTPPIPDFAASHAPSKAGSPGTISSMVAGRWCPWRKSRKVSS